MVSFLLLEFKDDVVGCIPEIIAAVSKGFKEIFSKSGIVDMF